MKKTIMTVMLALATCTLTFAQSEDNRKEPPSKTEMIQHQTDRTVEALGLDSDQAAKLLELNTAYADKMPMGGGPGGPRGPRPGGCCPESCNQGASESATKPEPPSKEDMEAKMKEMQANREAYDKELQEILTADQYTKYQELQKQRMQRRPGGRGPGGEKPAEQAVN